MKNVYQLLALAIAMPSALDVWSQPQPEGREMGYAVSLAQDNDFPAAIAKAQAACMATIHISTPWRSLRPDAATWDAAVLADLDLINLYFQGIGVKVELQLQVVNTVVDEMPADLTGLPYDDPMVISTMLETLDTLFAHLPDVELAAFNISNESDALWGTNATRYTQFAGFLQAVKPHAKALYGANHNGDTLSVGTTFTSGGLTDPATVTLCQITNSAADHISATYYGIQNDFTVKPPGEVITDLDQLVALHPGTQPIRLAEIGYPTGAICASNEELQRQFVEATFTAWDQHTDRIKYMGWFATTDLDSAVVDSLGAYYGLTAPVFLDYLRTLGLRTFTGAGTDKPAYTTLLCELQARGFCSAACTQGLVETTRPSVMIAPNPAGDRITFYSQGMAWAQRHIMIVNAVGQIVYTGTTDANGDMDVRGLAPGYYAATIGEATQPVVNVVRFVRQ